MLRFLFLFDFGMTAEKHGLRHQYESSSPQSLNFLNLLRRATKKTRLPPGARSRRDAVFPPERDLCTLKAALRGINLFGKNSRHLRECAAGHSPL
jgi:hypothetical protein